MPEDLKLSQIGSSQLPPPFRRLHSPGVRKHCQIIFACYFRKSSIGRGNGVSAFQRKLKKEEEDISIYINFVVFFESAWNTISHSLCAYIKTNGLFYFSFSFCETQKAAANKHTKPTSQSPNTLFTSTRLLSHWSRCSWLLLSVVQPDRYKPSVVREK